MPRAILGLGSNKGDRAQYLARAITALTTGKDPVLQQVTLSPIYESAALLPEGAPASWDLPFLNMAIGGDCLWTAEAVLWRIKEIERALGRQEGGHWAPREIDIDFLALDDTLLSTKPLTLPHPRLLERDFALLPLADIAPEWHYPAAGNYRGKTARELVGLLGMRENTRCRKRNNRLQPADTTGKR